MTLRPALLPLAVLLAALPLHGCVASGAGGGPTADPAVLTSTDVFADYLRGNGIVVGPPSYSSTSSYLDLSTLNGSITSHLVRVGASGEESAIVIYPFVSPEAAEANIFGIAEDRAAPGIGGQRFVPRDKEVYQNGALVVVYYGRDASIRGTLRNALGPVKRR